MNREQFLGFMESPAKLRADSLVLLEGLLKEFPYCQTARMLYLKALHNQKSIHYNSQLKITAAYAGNRKNLYRLILQSDLNSKTVPLAVGTTSGETIIEAKAKPPVLIPKPLTRPASVIANNPVSDRKVDQKEETAKTKSVNAENPLPVDPKPVETQQKPIERTPEKSEKDKSTFLEPGKEGVKRGDISKDKPAAIIPEPEKTPIAPVDKTPEKIVSINDKSKIVEPAKETKKTEEINKEKEAVVPEPSKAPPAPAEKITEKNLAERDKPNITDPGKEAIKTGAIIKKNTIPIIPDPVKVLSGAPEKAKEVETTQKPSGQEKENIKVELPVEKKTVVETSDPEKELKNEDNIGFTDGIEELEQEILNEAISAAIQTEEVPPLLQREPTVDDPREKVLKNENEFLNKTGQHSFTEWLKLVNKNNKPDDNNLPHAREEVKLNELVERFINEAPKIKPIKTEFFSPVNMARLSMIEDWTFVTETLAKVYAKQGNYLKAIKAYENLILKYPEKNAYFAAQIHSLKEKNSK